MSVAHCDDKDTGNLLHEEAQRTTQLYSCTEPNMRMHPKTMQIWPDLDEVHAADACSPCDKGYQTGLCVAIPLLIVQVLLGRAGIIGAALRFQFPGRHGPKLLICSVEGESLEEDQMGSSAYQHSPSDPMSCGTGTAVASPNLSFKARQLAGSKKQGMWKRKCAPDSSVL